jgi:hypothetical protein
VTGDPTYADVAKWIPTDVREAIEAATPCPVSGAHDWRHHCTELHTFGLLEPVAVIEHWTCPCGLAHTTNPEERR